MLHVCCVRWGSAYSVEYVERLHDMVRRNLAAGFPGRFVCFTDRPGDLSHLAGVDREYLPGGYEGWWNKLALFAPHAFPNGDRVLYLDLDTVITGSLDEIAAYSGPFAILRDAYRRDGLQSSVMAWEAGSVDFWRQWQAIGCPTPDGGDQAIIERFAVSPVLLQETFPGSFHSYKVDCVWGIPKGSRVVFFHGRPRPHEVQTGWVPEVWKVGGGTSAELVMVGTVPQEKVLRNVQSAIAADYPVLEPGEPIASTAVICGGGPSLADNRMLVASLQRGGAAIFSCNQSDAYLRACGIQPNFHVMLDARPDHVRMVNEGGIKLYASMCDPLTLQAGAAAGDLVIWHPVTDGIEDVLKGERVVLIGGGTTVGCHAMVVAHVIGFRKLICVGFDSCYRSGDHHAYAQALNDGERVLDVIAGGEKFKAAPWMVQQAEDWKKLAVELLERGCEITIFGDGLIPTMARTLNEEYALVDGLLWPARDQHTREALLATLADLTSYIEACPERRVAVQAGGNVGVFPKELAKHFTQVITFEPDPKNWHCLSRNVREPNVASYHMALGDTQGSTGINSTDTNCGASYLEGAGEIPVGTLDALNLEFCDLLQLDIEGYEFQALLGAEQTIARCAPLIVLELKGHGQRYGYTDDQVIHWLEERGYERVSSAHRDVVFKRRTHAERAA